MIRLTNIRRSFCAAMLVIGAVFATVQAAQATSGKAALDRFVRYANLSDLIHVTYADAQESGNTLSVTGLEIVIEGAEILQLLSQTFRVDLPEEADQLGAALQYRIDLDSVSLEGLRDRGNAIEIRAFEAPRVDINVGGQGPGSSLTSYLGVDARDIDIAKWPFIRLSQDQPVSQFVPFLLAMSDVDLSSLTIEAVETTSPIEDGVELTQTYADVRVGPTIDGDVSTFDATDFTMSIASSVDQMPAFNFTAQAMSARDYNSGTMLRTLLGTPPDDEAVKTAIGRLQMDQMTFSSPQEDTSVTIGRVELLDIGVKPVGDDFLDLLDGFVYDALGGEIEPDEREIIEFVGSIYGAFSLGRFQIEGISARAENLGTPSDTLNAIDLARITIADLSADGLGEFSIDDLALAGADGEDVQVGRYAIEGMTFPPLAALLDLERAMLENDVAAILRAIPTLDRVVQDGVVVIIPDERTDFSLASSIFEMSDHVGPIPTGIRLDIEQMQMSTAALEPEERDPFDQLGLDDISVDVQAQINWRRPTTDADLDVLLSVEQLGTLTGNGIIGNVPAIVFDQPGQISVFALLGATLNNVSLRYEDAGAIERGIVAAASREGLSYEAIELRWKGMIPVLLSELDNIELAGEITDALTAVIERGAPVAMTAKAVTPLPLAAISASNPAALARLFEIEVENR